MLLGDIKLIAQTMGLTLFTGYAPTGARVPYAVQRPAVLDPDSLAVSGDALGWDDQVYLYCCGASVEASYNLAVEYIQALQATPASGTTITCTVGYIGGAVEGHYETQVTAQVHQGGI